MANEPMQKGRTGLTLDEVLFRIPEGLNGC